MGIQQMLMGSGGGRLQAAITISSNTQNYVLNTAKVAGYVAGQTDVTLTINSSIIVGSASAGSYALDVDTSWAAGDTVNIVNGGFIVGKGGNGGDGGTYNCGQINATAGGAGGPALRAQRAISITNNNIVGGGGGGGGGGNGGFFTGQPVGGGGGGGGAGNSVGSGGALGNLSLIHI